MPSGARPGAPRVGDPKIGGWSLASSTAATVSATLLASSSMRSTSFPAQTGGPFERKCCGRGSSGFCSEKSGWSDGRNRLSIWAATANSPCTAGVRKSRMRVPTFVSTSARSAGSNDAISSSVNDAGQEVPKRVAQLFADERRRLGGGGDRLDRHHLGAKIEPLQQTFERGAIQFFKRQGLTLDIVCAQQAKCFLQRGLVERLDRGSLGHDGGGQRNRSAQ